MAERRQARRVAVSVSTVLEAEGIHYVAEAGDLSEGGLFLHTKTDFPMGTRLHLVFGLPPHLPRIDAEGVVRWSKSSEGVGVEFTSLRLEHKGKLLRFLNSGMPQEEESANEG